MKDVSSFLQSALCQTRPRFSFSSLMLYFFPPPCLQKQTKAFILTLRDKDFHYIKMILTVKETFTCSSNRNRHQILNCFYNKNQIRIQNKRI